MHSLWQIQDATVVVSSPHWPKTKAPPGANGLGRGSTGPVTGDPLGVGVFYLVLAAFSALRSARYFLIRDLATFRCSPQTIPKTGAARFLQPGTGQY